MSQASQARLARVRRYSASLRSVFRFLSVFVTLGTLVSLFVLLTRHGDGAPIVVWNAEFAGAAVTPALKWAIAVWMLLLAGITIKLLHHLARLFGLYSQGAIFTAANVAQIRQLGITVLLFFLSSMYASLAKIALVLIDGSYPATVGNGNEFTISLNGSFMQLLVGIAIIVISWIMDVGRELREESELTV